MDDAMKAALAAKGYDLIEKDGSDSDDDPIPGRIPSLAPDVAREKGKKYFEQGKYDKAIKCWQGGLKHILSSLCSGPQALGDQSLSELDLTLNLNIAMAYMKKGDFESADRSVEKALARREALPPHLITKALYRKASAQRSMRRLEECMETLKDLLQVEEGHAAAKQMYQEVEREWNKQVREQKKALKKLWSKMEGEDKVEEKRQLEARASQRERCAVKWLEGDVDSESFALGDTPECDGKDWGLSFTRTVLWAIEEFAVEGHSCLPQEEKRACFWFIGASSTCELRHLKPSEVMRRLPGVESVELALIGFLGELTPENKREPDPKVDSLPSKAVETTVDGGPRRVTLRIVKGTLQDALQKELRPAGDAPLAEGAAKEEQRDPPAATPLESAEAAVEATAAPAAGATPEAASGEASGLTAEQPTAPTEEPAERHDGPPPQVPPTVCFIAHPQLHRYFTEFHPAISWLVQHQVPTVLIGASEPDPSWKQDEILLRALGCTVVVGKRKSPYPMTLPDNPDVRKCSHVVGFLGGKALPRESLTKVKLDLLAQDYIIR